MFEMQTSKSSVTPAQTSQKLVEMCIPTFEEFWAAWPKREAKKDARKAWDKLALADRVAALAALPLHVARWRREGRVRNHIPHPATWLNGERWEDELGEIFSPAQAQPKPPLDAWWTSHVGMERKGREVGVGPARPGEMADQYRARINAAIDDLARFGKA